MPRTRCDVPSLCHREDASCGACCGLYNREDLSPNAVRAELRRTTELLAQTPLTEEAYRAAGAQRARELPVPLFPSVRICPMLGFLGPTERRVGCLAHPLVTGGEDLRSCGAYGPMTCQAFLCPSHRSLCEEEAALVAQATGDYYLYGLVVTDAPFVRAVLDALEARTGERPAPPHLAHRPFGRAFRSLLSVKEELAPGSEGAFGAFRPLGEEERPATSPVERILEALGGDLRSGNDAERLEAEIHRRTDEAAAALRETIGAGRTA
ncbi:MAG TPA: hypothetical protein VFG53_03925 [Anaeromyxobacter sp.]|nr:hypothetical protein [Anaeromyxobacter sp.]